MTDLPETMQRGLELCFMTARCADGRFIQMCARQDVHFRNWLRALGLQDALHDERFTGLPLGIPSLAAVAELESLVRARMATRSRDDWMRLFSTEFDVGADPFLTPVEFLSHPQLTANDRVVTTADPILGPVRQIGLLARLDATPGSVRGPAPCLGSDTVDGVSQTWPMGTSATVAAGDPHELPLAGITVLELAHFVAGPLAGTLLAEMGARVIKIEPLAGDPFRRTGAQSVKFLVGKESIAIDLKHPHSQAIVDGLIERSDVFVHSFRPDVPARLGLDHERLAALAPRLIYVNASAYGSRGPQRGRSAFHSTPTALSGAGFLQAGSGNPPVDDSFPDPGGALGVATAVLLALHARQLTGRGQYVETTMLTSAGYVMSAELAQYAGAPDIPIPDNGQHGRGALYRLYSCAAGWLFLAAVDPADWEAVVDVLAHPAWASEEQFADPAGRLLNWTSLAEALATALMARPAQDWVTALQARGVGAVVVTERPSETWLQEHDLLSADQHPAFGDYWRLPPKLTWASTVPGAAPAAALGEHSLDLLAELGYSDDAIATLVADGVVGTWSRDTAAVLG
jgi:crotonobetainyl-CoA:carnitine CoA-transferase CaiB-like acyl-CoA transferase